LENGLEYVDKHESIGQKDNNGHNHLSHIKIDIKKINNNNTQNYKIIRHNCLQ